MATIDGSREGFSLLRIDWPPAVSDHEKPPLTDGLCAWATKDEGVVLHLTSAWYKDGYGLLRVLPVQMATALDKNFHGHARTLRRLKARGIEVLPYVGELTVDDSFDLSWLAAAGGKVFLPTLRTWPRRCWMLLTGFGRARTNTSSGLQSG